MNPLDRLAEYLRAVERRLRLLTLSRGAAITAGAALLATIVAVLVANHFAFSDPSVLGARVLLFVCIALALALGLVVPALALSRRGAVKRIEGRFPEFDQRLLTFAERSDGTDDGFIQLLAADTLPIAQRSDVAAVAPPAHMFGLLGIALISLSGLWWLTTSGSGFLGYGASLLWGGISDREMRPFYDIVVEPGNRTVRKKSDQRITARLNGFQSDRVRVFAKYASSSRWEEAAMSPQSGTPGFEFLFAGIPESVEYYVEAAGVQSKTYRLKVVDLPAVKHIRVTYTFPRWTGLKPAVEDPGGDLRAVEGTVAEVAIETDRPLSNGSLLLDDGTKVDLRALQGNWRAASVPIQKDGLYHVAAMDQAEAVRLSDDYFIEAQKESPPVVKIVRPGRDARVNPIEEVTVGVEAQDDFGLQAVDLHYIVNGGPEKTVSLLKSRGRKQADGTTVLYLEDFKMAPGDIVSLYAVARDARSSTKTDMFFVEAQPFEREYSQSQAGGGGGEGGEQDDSRISQRQKEIIAATWNQIKETSGDQSGAGANAIFLSDVQSKLRDQARSLAARMRSRQLSGASEEFKAFAEDMEKAVEAMGPATEKLRGKQWQNALGPEQKALQHLLRAEATFRQIQVAFGSGGGGGAGGAGRDLESLFDLELDTEKNQYESGQQSASADQRQREIDEALQKLERLAKRQQELAEQQRKDQQSFQQRWQQEMLRREAEELRRQMEQLSRNGSQRQSGQQQSGQQQSGQQQSGQQQSGQSGQQGRSGQQSGQQSAQQRSGQQQSREQQSQQPGTSGHAGLEQALRRLEQATRDMRQAASSQNAGNPEQQADARRAAERLQEARGLLSGMRREQATGQLSDLTRKAEQLATQQQDFDRRMRQTFGFPGQQGQAPAQPGQSRQAPEQMASEKERMAGDLERLEREVQRASRDLAGTERGASNKLREALGAMQQDELGTRMRRSAEAIRRGLGPYAVMREPIVTQGVNRFRDQLREAEQARGKGQHQGGDPRLEQALAQAERLRRQLEEAARGKSGRPGDQQAGNHQRAGKDGSQRGQGEQSGEGQQPGQAGRGQQPGQAAQGSERGQQNGQGPEGAQQGQQAGQNGRGERSGQPSREGGNSGREQGGSPETGISAMNRGDWSPLGGGAPPPSDPRAVETTLRETIRDLSQMQRSMQGNPEVARDIQDLIRDMQQIDPRRFQGKELDQRIESQAVAGLAQIELELRRLLDGTQGGNVRADAAHEAPPGYQNAVADYFRRLSKGK